MKKLRRKFLKSMLFIVFVFSSIFFILSFSFLAILSTLPDVKDPANLNPRLSSVILDKEGNVLYTIFGQENREQVALDDVSSNLKNATVVVEDENFWNHHGLDIRGLYRAFSSNIFGVGKKTGGSTITQQYAKNAFLSPEKTITRKLKEAILALNMEINYSKDEILELYLNKIPYGNNAFGIKKASELYFGLDPKHLSIAQSAVLATLPQAPSRYSPYSDNRYSRLVVEIDDEYLSAQLHKIEGLVDENILEKLESDVKIEESDMIGGSFENIKNKAKYAIRTNSSILVDENMFLNNQNLVESENIEALEIIEGEDFEGVNVLANNEDKLVLREIKSEEDLFENEFVQGLIGSFANVGDKEIWISGKADFVVDKMFEKGLISLAERNEAYEELSNMVFNNYRENILHPHFVFYILQELEKVYGRDFLENGGLKIHTSLDPKIQNFVEDLAKKRKNTINKWAGANNMAILSVEAKTGNILAMLGSFDFFDESIDGNVNVVLRARQPGSSVKPFIYAKMFLNGFAPSTRIDDSPMKIGDRRPQNFDGGFTGNISVREALGKSRNIPAVRAYYLAGEQTLLIPFMKELGLKSLKDSHDYGYPLAIGAGEVSLFEMVQGYSVFANNGVKVDIGGILMIEDFSGNIIYEKSTKEKQVLDSSIAYLINSILSDRSVSIGKNLFVGSHIVAAKSGTSTKASKGRGAVRPGDLWTVGYNPSFVTGVWIGNTDGKGLNFSAEAYTYASPVFSLVMKELLTDRMLEPFPVPEGIKSLWVSRRSGLLPAKNTPREDFVLEYFAENYYIQRLREIYIPPLIVLEN